MTYGRTRSKMRMPKKGGIAGGVASNPGGSTTKPVQSIMETAPLTGSQAEGASDMGAHAYVASADEEVEITHPTNIYWIGYFGEIVFHLYLIFLGGMAVGELRDKNWAGVSTWVWLTFSLALASVLWLFYATVAMLKNAAYMASLGVGGPPGGVYHMPYPILKYKVAGVLFRALGLVALSTCFYLYYLRFDSTWDNTNERWQDENFRDLMWGVIACAVVFAYEWFDVMIQMMFFHLLTLFCNLHTDCVEAPKVEFFPFYGGRPATGRSGDGTVV